MAYVIKETHTVEKMLCRGAFGISFSWRRSVDSV